MGAMASVCQTQLKKGMWAFARGTNSTEKQFVDTYYKRVKGLSRQELKEYYWRVTQNQKKDESAFTGRRGAASPSSQRAAARCFDFQSIEEKARKVFGGKSSSLLNNFLGKFNTTESYTQKTVLNNLDSCFPLCHDGDFYWRECDIKKLQDRWVNRYSNVGAYS